MFEKILFLIKLDKYMCVSNYTKNSIRLLYGISDTKLITIYNGIDPNVRNFDKINKKNILYFKKKFNLNNSYI
jgi:hypothetical protein